MTDRYLARLWDIPEQWTGLALHEKDGVYLSPTGRWAAFSKAVVFARADVADLCLGLWMPRLRQRWGDDFRIELERWRNASGPKPADLQNVALLLAKARSGRWASNQSVPAEAVQAALQELESFGA